MTLQIQINCIYISSFCSNKFCRFNNFGPDRRHMSCHFKKTAPYRLKPIKREIMRRALEMHKQAMLKEEQQNQEEKALMGESVL